MDQDHHSAVGVAGVIWLIFIFLSAFTELTMSSVMASTDTKTIGLTIFNLQQAGDYSLAAAVSSVILIVMMIGSLLRLLGK